MGKIADMISNLKSLTVEKQVDDIAKIVRRNEDTIVDMNRDQMMAGEDSSGKPIGKYSNPVYEDFKKFLNPKAGGKVDLFLEGGFQREMFLKGTAFPFTTDSTNYKRKKLIEGDGYGENTFGINEQNKEVLRQDVLKEEIQDYYRGKILNVR